MSRIARKVKAERALKLIRRYLEAGMMSEGTVSARTKGTPQGAPLSREIVVGNASRNLPNECST